MPGTQYRLQTCLYYYHLTKTFAITKFTFNSYEKVLLSHESEFPGKAMGNEMCPHPPLTALIFSILDESHAIMIPVNMEIFESLDKFLWNVKGMLSLTPLWMEEKISMVHTIFSTVEGGLYLRCFFCPPSN